MRCLISNVNGSLISVSWEIFQLSKILCNNSWIFGGFNFWINHFSHGQVKMYLRQDKQMRLVDAVSSCGEQIQYTSKLIKWTSSWGRQVHWVSVAACSRWTGVVNRCGEQGWYFGAVSKWNVEECWTDLCRNTTNITNDFLGSKLIEFLSLSNDLQMYLGGYLAPSQCL